MSPGAVLGPLVMLATGLVAALALWRFLMLESPRPAVSGPPGERLSWHDHQALDRLLDRRGDAR